ncbi:CAAX prenyl protease 1 [Thecamonas trahens ATCC 50062]|uniref:CAAX prenyl protease n=1 Tax=Thecamonas trahens ATCC 50062 TaxID=461836 RepID=A0A0L0D4X4_THETB|nr:CAAX prenyl protease 1 [Thecamonas trahens ATCC 50062]KNC47422.1 CAAX prenyl protease 1 [Thecamonas trahens ATCC 50062]|eukprot:XP_013759758.1 CAAX prenyl protease 1 [Thecamonas trahens ATCC 50062]
MAIAFDVLASVWAMVSEMEVVGDSPRLTLMVYVALLGAVVLVTSLPSAAWSTFVIEKRFGFFTGSIWLWLGDTAKSAVVAGVIGLPLALALDAALAWGSTSGSAYLYAWAVLVSASVVLLFAHPRLIAPCFNTFTPASDALLARITTVANKAGFPLGEVMVMDGSRMSNHSNAYMYGMCSAKRIVLFDTLLDQVDQDGVVAILGHEMGHYVLGHTWWNLIIVQAYALGFLYAFSQAMAWPGLVEAFGFGFGFGADGSAGDLPPHLIRLVVFSFLAVPVDAAVSLGMHMLSRKFEYDADAYAVDLGLDLVPPLQALHRENKSMSDPHPLYSAYHYTHPPVTERVAAIKARMEARGRKTQ